MFEDSLSVTGKDAVPSVLFTFFDTRERIITWLAAPGLGPRRPYRSSANHAEKDQGRWGQRPSQQRLTARGWTWAVS